MSTGGALLTTTPGWLLARVAAAQDMATIKAG